MKMTSFSEILKHPDELYPLVNLIWTVVWQAKKQQVFHKPYWSFCYSMLRKVSLSFCLVIHQLHSQLRDALCVFYLVLRVLDTIEDDMSIPEKVKAPLLVAFHQHIHDVDWHFSCGNKNYKLLMDEFHHVSTAFLELRSSYREIIEDVTKTMGAGMAKFICKEVETIDDYDEYCGYAAGFVGISLSRLFHASGVEILSTDSEAESVGLFLQKTNVIRDYLEDINEVQKPRMFWPRQIWSKYANKLEDFKYAENSIKSLQCLNEMVTNVLLHVEDCLKLMSGLRDPYVIRSCGIPQIHICKIVAMGTLALCYNNIQVFRGAVKMRRGVDAKIFVETRTMSDVYGAFYDFSSVLMSKVNHSDPNATTTLSTLEAIQKTCKESGNFNKSAQTRFAISDIVLGLIRKSCIIEAKPSYKSAMIVVLFTIMAILFAYLSAN